MKKPLFRRKINKAVEKYAQAKKMNTTKTFQSDTGQKGEYDFAGLRREINARKELDKKVSDRKKGLTGFIRKIVSGKNAVERQKNIKTIKNLRKKGLIVEKNLKILHPLLKTIKINDAVEIISIRGNVRKGIVTDANKNAVYIQMSGYSKPVGLKLDQLKIIKKMK